MSMNNVWYIIELQLLHGIESSIFMSVSELNCK